jgi:anti-sigma B factor antagonist
MGATSPGASLRIVAKRAGTERIGTDQAIGTEHAVVLFACGELDIATGPQLEAAVAATLAWPQTTCVTLDCSGLSFLDAAGLAALLRAWTTLRDHGRTLTVCNPRAHVRELLSLTGTAGPLGLAETQAEPAAAARLTARRPAG